MFSARSFPLLVSLALLSPAAGAERSEAFRADPDWHGFRNRLVPSPPPRTRQDFGYRTTQRAKGERGGEIGGWVQRSVTPAWYAKVIAPKTLGDRLTASGKLAVTRAEGGSGVLFGWFNKDSRGWRAPNSLAVRLDGNGGNYWVFFEYGTKEWRTGGGATFEGRYQTTKTKPCAGDGTVHAWTLAYDPSGSGGDGEVTFTFDGEPFRAALLPGHKADGAVFDRFGVFNQQLTGDGMELYLDDLTIDGEPAGFDRDPGWEARGNAVEFEDRVIRPRHDFGFSLTSHAGGREKGEIGGILWRDESPAYYAAETRGLSLERELSASGRIAFTGAGSDSGAYFGWFRAADMKERVTSTAGKDERRSFLGILVEGPSRDGHYFRPAYRTGSGEGALRDDGPIIRPDGKAHVWSMRYSPGGAGGRGRITFALDGETQELDLAPGHRAAGAAFDRFGIFNAWPGGHYVELYLDDVSFTAK